MSDSSPIFCHRCGAELIPGSFYLVKIEAYADPAANLAGSAAGAGGGDLQEQIHQTLQQIEQMSEQELMDCVYRRMTLHLCQQCYPQWMENPAGA